MMKMYKKTLFTAVLVVAVLSACTTTTDHKKSSDLDQQDLAYKLYRENLTRHNPRAAKINVQLAMGYLKQGNVQQAQSKMELAMQQDKQSSVVLGGMAYFLEKTGEPEKADAYYRQAIQHAEDKGEANNNYGAFLCRKKHYSDAITYFLKAVNDQHYQTAGEAYENAGICALKIPDERLAEHYFRKALEKQPRLPTALLEMGTISYDGGNYTLADDYLRQYKKLAEPTPQSIWLAEQIAHEIDQKGRPFRRVS
jgi:type IV pilus assembly protein PilF